MVQRLNIVTFVTRLTYFALSLSIGALLSSTPLHAADRLDFHDNKARIETRTATLSSIPPKAQGVLNEFFGRLKKGKIELAFFKLFDGTQFMREKDLIDSFGNASRDAQTRFGKIKKIEELRFTPLSARMFLTSHLVIHQTKIYRWRFLFMAPVGNDWKLVNLQIDDFRDYLPEFPNRERPPKEVEANMGTFFLQIQAGQVQTAFTDLLKGSKIKNQDKYVPAFAQRLTEAMTEYGQPVQYELHDHLKAGKQIRLLTYFIYLKSEPLRCQLVYELSGPEKTAKWSLINLRIDDLLDEAILRK